MSQPARPASAASIHMTPTAPTLPSAPAIPRGIAATPSTLSPAAAAESPSCLSQIGSMISSIVSSIFSLISSLWNCVTGGVSQAAAPTAPAQSPAEVLSSHAQRFFNEITSRTIRQGTPRKVALLIKIDGQRVALFTRDLLSTDPLPNPFIGFCEEGMERLRELLRRQPSLTPQSTVELSVANIKRDSEPEGRNPNTPASSNLITTTLSASGSFISSNIREGTTIGGPVHAAAQSCSNTMFANDTPGEDRLRRAFLFFVANHANAVAGWTMRE